MAEHPHAGALEGGSPRVALLFADALAAIETAWSLRAAGAHVLAIASAGRKVPLRHSRKVQVVEVTAPERDRVRCQSEIQETVRKYGIDHLLLLDDVSIALVEELELPCHVVGPTGTQARLALDKSRQIAAARAAGFAVPPTVVIDDPRDVGELATPLVLKPVDAARLDDGRAVRGPTFLCADPNELKEGLRGIPAGHRYLAQELIVGRGRGVFGLHTERGIEHWSGHLRIRMMNPAGSGSSACEPAGVSEEIAAATKQLLHDAGWHGLFMVELLETPDGKIWFIELNGRPWGSMALSRAVGLEYPAWAVAAAEDPAAQFSPRRPKRPPRLARHLGREIVHLAFVFRGPRTRTPILWPKRRKALLEVLRVQRGTRWYNWHPGEFAVFVADTWRTVSEQARRWRR